MNMTINKKRKSEKNKLTLKNKDSTSRSKAYLHYPRLGLAIRVFDIALMVRNLVERSRY